MSQKKNREKAKNSDILNRMQYKNYSKKQTKLHLFKDLTDTHTTLTHNTQKRKPITSALPKS